MANKKGAQQCGKVLVGKHSFSPTKSVFGEAKRALFMPRRGFCHAQTSSRQHETGFSNANKGFRQVKIAVLPATIHFQARRNRFLPAPKVGKDAGERIDGLGSSFFRGQY
jgi:hypothetical protein